MVEEKYRWLWSKHACGLFLKSAYKQHVHPFSDVILHLAGVICHVCFVVRLALSPDHSQVFSGTHRKILKHESYLGTG